MVIRFGDIATADVGMEKLEVMIGPGRGEGCSGQRLACGSCLHNRGDGGIFVFLLFSCKLW